VEITAAIFRQQDPFGEGELVDKILDKARQKGTGKWTSQNAMDLGIPVPSIDISVSMREISALKAQRMAASQTYQRPVPDPMAADELENLAENALYFSFMMTYAQGMHQLTDASREYSYELDLGTIARIWRAGCIIRAALLEDITLAYSNDPELENLLLSPVFIPKIRESVEAARILVAYGAKNGVPLPALSNSLTYFDAFSSARLPLNLIQAQRDHFGSHTYERTDREGIFHTEWD
jgi:6-phosphogluconate dehydrogenase